MVSSQFLVKVRPFILILLYNCFAHELVMQQVRICVQFARSLQIDSTEECKLSKRLNVHARFGCVPELRVLVLNAQNLNSWHFEVQV